MRVWHLPSSFKYRHVLRPLTQHKLVSIQNTAAQCPGGVDSVSGSI